MEGRFFGKLRYGSGTGLYVYQLSSGITFFLPRFNMGCGEGIQVGADNPLLEDEYSVHYMWDDILQKDSLLEVLGKFMFIEVSEKEDANGKVKKKRNCYLSSLSSTVNAA